MKRTAFYIGALVFALVGCQETTEPVEKEVSVIQTETVVPDENEYRIVVGDSLIDIGEEMVNHSQAIDQLDIAPDDEAYNEVQTSIFELRTAVAEADRADLESPGAEFDEVDASYDAIIELLIQYTDEAPAAFDEFYFEGSEEQLNEIYPLVEETQTEMNFMNENLPE